MMRRDAVFAMPPVEFLVDGLITDTGFTMMYGAPGTGKSFLAIDIALSVAHGQPWQGQGVKQGPVLYIAGEGIGGFGKRWKAWERHHGKVDEPDLYLLPTAVNFREPEDIARLVAPSRTSAAVLARHRRYGGACHRRRREQQHRHGLVRRRVRIKALTGGALLAVHHAGKDGSRRGSTALLGAVDTSLMVGKSKTSWCCVPKNEGAGALDDINLRMVTVAARSPDIRRCVPRAKPKKKKAWVEG